MKNLIITDKNSYNNKKETILYINKYCTNLKDFSILNFIEENSDEIKKNFKKDLKKLLNNLQNDKQFFKKKSFNYFYNFFLFDRSIYKYPSINEYIKIVAFKKFFEKKEITSVHLKIIDRKLYIAIKNILLKKKIKFTEETPKSFFDFNFSIKFILVIYRILKFSFERMFLKTFSKNIPNSKNYIISYLAYIDDRELNKKNLKTIYWSNIFDDSKKNFFFYIYNENSRKKLKKIYEIQKNKETNFIILDTILDLADHLLIFKDWGKLFFKFLYKKNKIKFYFDNMNDSFYIFKNDIKNSFYGFDSFINIYYNHLFRKLSKQNLRSQTAFYISENQGWEKSFNYFFKNKVKKTHAVIGTPVRYWDTRYLDEDNFIYLKNKKKYLPDNYLVNSELSEKNLLNNGYKNKKIFQVEALRYRFKKTKTNKRVKKNFFVAGDYSFDENQKLEELIFYLAKIYKNEKFFIKQHPNLELSKRLRNLKNCIFIYDKDISELSNYCGKAIIPNMTSASIDSIMSDLKTVILYRDNQINFSPLKGVKGILHEKDTKMIIKYFDQKLTKKINKKNLLNLNLTHKLWRKFI